MDKCTYLMGRTQRIYYEAHIFFCVPRQCTIASDNVADILAKGDGSDHILTNAPQLKYLHRNVQLH
ncbi:hypothetical protein PILCRDRAFT_822111 [Piloderma croceum F 1598]|uniref:Uncharacterized protein n=1 Tax=Piloderma croceum (strain F 1598) TaxID=765440 RepID=A0A0C3F830_PILCF|nr:hypothetical protein PILCRDRAFT_822111 [Piloderma croceum F 1598]